MKKSLIVVVCAAILSGMLLCGCSTTHISQPSAPLTVKLEVEKAPVVEVGAEITGEATVKRILCFKYGADKFADGVNYGGAQSYSMFGGDTYTDVKAAAAFDACQKNNADVIIAPRYKLKNDNYFFYEKTKAIVTGYKGTFKGVKKK